MLIAPFQIQISVKSAQRDFQMRNLSANDVFHGSGIDDWNDFDSIIERNDLKS